LKNQTELIAATFKEALKDFRRSDITNACSQTNGKRLAIKAENKDESKEPFMLQILTGTTTIKRNGARLALEQIRK